MKFVKGFALPDGYPDGGLGSMGQNTGVRSGNVQSFENALDRSKILRIFCTSFNKPVSSGFVSRMRTSLPGANAVIYSSTKAT